MPATADNATKRVIAEMLTENTGTHMLDSGGAYGRNWERNQGHTFENEPESEFDYVGIYDPSRWGKTDMPTLEFTINHSVYHWLCACVDYDEELDKKFNEWADLFPEQGWLQLMDSFPKFAHGRDVRGIYGDGGPVTVNTYNHESMLSQVLQYTYWEHDGDGYALIQIHGGCDVRGGYTKPRAFNAYVEGDPVGLFDDNRWGIGCSNCRAIWSYGNGGEYNDSDYNDHIVPELKEIEAIEGTQENAEQFCTDTLKGTVQTDKLIDVPAETSMLTIKHETRIEQETKVVITEKPEKGYPEIFCPVCGKGTLSPYWY